MKRLTVVSVLGAVLTLSTAVFAQAQTSPQPSSQPSTHDQDTTRSATTTVSGTTGLWNVPTAEVLGANRWSASFYRTNVDDDQGFTDISTFPLTFAYGLANRAELFGNWVAVTRIDRDTRPLFFTDTAGENKAGAGGGLVADYPFDRSGWIGNRRGDLWLGGKINLSADSKSPLAFATRLMVKLPVGDKTHGASTGKADFQADGIVSTYNRLVELSGYGGVIVRGNPDGYTLTNGLRWGVGAGFPQRYNLGFKVTAELYGERYFNNTITAPAGLLGDDGSMVPTSTGIKSPAILQFGLTWQAPNGFFVGAATSWNVSMNDRMAAGFPDTSKDDKGFEVRIGIHPGVHDRAGTVAVAPPPPPAPPAPPVRTGPGGNAPANGPGGNQGNGPGNGAQAPAAANRPPTVHASCDPCTVEVGRTSTVTADAQDPDGDPLTYQWTTQAGSLASPTSRQSLWTAPMQVGPVPFTVVVNDGKGGTAQDTVTIQVIQPAARQYTFEDVYFEFDRFTLRPDALHVLDDAVAAMQANATLRLTIEGYTCNIGTAEYNLALGERRAQAVRNYLVSRGIAADRLRTVSYGEERAKFDNSREETRRLNRRAALVVRLE